MGNLQGKLRKNKTRKQKEKAEDKCNNRISFHFSENNLRIDRTTTASTPWMQNEPPISSYEFETTPENVNFFRFARLILDVCLDVLRDLIQSKISGGERELTKKIALNRNIILRSCRLSDNQENIIFPSNNGVVQYKSLDFTLIYLICRNVLHEEIETDSIKNKRWGKRPSPWDTSLLAAIERIRECRNEFFAHATSSEMTNMSFKSLWMNIESSIDIINDHLDPTVASGNYKNIMEKLKTSSTDPKLREALIEKIKLEKICDLNFEKEVRTDVMLRDIVDMRRTYSMKSLEVASSLCSAQMDSALGASFRASTGNLIDSSYDIEINHNFSSSRSSFQSCSNILNFDPQSEHDHGGLCRSERYSCSCYHCGNREVNSSQLSNLELFNQELEHRSEMPRTKSFIDPYTNRKNITLGKSYEELWPYDIDCIHHQHDMDTRTTNGIMQRSLSHNQPFHTPPQWFVQENPLQRETRNVSDISQRNTDPFPSQRTSFEKVTSPSRHIQQTLPLVEVQSEPFQTDLERTKYETGHQTMTDIDQKMEFEVTLMVKDGDYGFTVSEQNGKRKACVGDVKKNGSAYLNGRLKKGDEITHVNGINTTSFPRHIVVKLIMQTLKNEFVTLGIRRWLIGNTNTNEQFFQVNQRRTESYGFTLHKMQSVMNKLATNDPAERHSCFREEDRILAANGVDISHMHPDDIYKLIKKTGSSITLKVEYPNVV
uniref:Uncharacterized protein LOC111099486 isoform X2 n=1 Tax=Crassostrea virginica TaxID=6565 RepID=A0A8B8A9E1_CRAVI|nr:uncharacterized protein LOC111099486 isoform X2 [Crassostrea virginica]